MSGLTIGACGRARYLRILSQRAALERLLRGSRWWMGTGVMYMSRLSLSAATLTEATSSRISDRPGPTDGGESRHLELCASDCMGRLSQ